MDLRHPDDALAAATFHLVHAALRAPDDTGLRDMALGAAQRLRAAQPAYGATDRAVLRNLADLPRAPGAGRLDGEVHAKLDAIHAALEVMHLRLAEAGANTHDQGRWDTLTGTLELALDVMRRSRVRSFDAGAQSL